MYHRDFACENGSFVMLICQQHAQYNTSCRNCLVINCLFLSFVLPELMCIFQQLHSFLQKCLITCLKAKVTKCCWATCETVSNLQTNTKPQLRNSQLSLLDCCLAVSAIYDFLRFHPRLDERYKVHFSSCNTNPCSSLRIPKIYGDPIQTRLFSSKKKIKI